jgi:DNA-directed RNA polymerase subunit RPC12/RpoP
MNTITPEDVEMLPCQYCNVEFSPDCAETFSDRFHGKGYKCPHCGKINS